MKQKKAVKATLPPMNDAEVRQYGFNWGPASITRCCDIRGTRILCIQSKRAELQINITPTGKLKAFVIRPNPPSPKK